MARTRGIKESERAARRATRAARAAGPHSPTPATADSTTDSSDERSSDSRASSATDSSATRSSSSSAATQKKLSSATLRGKASRKTAKQSVLPTSSTQLPPSGKASRKTSSANTQVSQVRSRSPSPIRRKTAGKKPRRAQVVLTGEGIVPIGFSGLQKDVVPQTRFPSVDELRDMPEVTTVEWKHRRTGDVLRYSKFDDVLVIPPQEDGKSIPDAEFGIKEVDLWRGRIVEMRGRENGDGDTTGSDGSRTTSEYKMVYVKLAWYYSPEWFRTVKAPKYRKTERGTNELIYVPTHTDWQEISALNGYEEIHHVDDADVDMDDVPMDAFYCRSKFDNFHMEWKKGPAKLNCVCKKTYKLYEDNEEMHYCASEGCQNWYHKSCLEAKNSRKRSKNIADFKTAWEEAVGNTERRPMSTILAQLKEQCDARIEEDGSPSPPDSDIAKSNRLKLRAWARRPIIRGGEEYGVQGNIAQVLRARLLLREAKKGLRIPDKIDFVKYKQRTRILPGSRKRVTERMKRSKMPETYELEGNAASGWYAYKCPKCDSII